MYRGVTLILGLIVLGGGAAFWSLFSNQPQPPQAVESEMVGEAVAALVDDDNASAEAAQGSASDEAVAAAEPQQADSGEVGQPIDSELSEDVTAGADVTTTEAAAATSTPAATTTTAPDTALAAIPETGAEEASAVADATDAREEGVETADALETEVAPAEEPAIGEPVSEEIAAVEEAPSDLADDLQTPAFDIVRIEPTGDALIAGNASPSARVGLVYNGELIAETEAGVTGDFVLVPSDPLPAGDGTLQVSVLDDAGDIAAMAEQEVAVVVPGPGGLEGFLVGLLRPGEPIEIIERQAPTSEEDVAAADVAGQVETEASVTDAPLAVEDGTSDALASVDAEQTSEQGATPEVETADQDAAEPAAEVASADAAADDLAAPPTVVVDAIELEGQRIWIAGGAEPGTTIRLYQDNALLGETVVGPQGRYLFEGELAPGGDTVTIRADALAPASADVVARALVPFRMPQGREPRDEIAASSVPQDPDEPSTPEPTLASVDPEASSTNEAPAADAEVAGQNAPLETAVVAQPSAAPVTTLVPQPSGRISVLDTGRVIIRRGDNLWAISRRVFGQGIRYTTIYDANRGQIEDPALIFPGQVFDLPQPDQEWGDVPGIDALDPDQRAPVSADN
ncbi:MAG: LysM peptidoglycan-binding domain-containing protein [Pseudomonadota bacterium]